MGKGTNSFDYRTFASYLLPKDILKFFEVTDIEEEHTGQLDQTGTEIVILRISLDELDNREQLGLDLRPNGFTEGCDVTDFPIRDHKVVLRIRRRRWLDADGHNAVFNNYELTAAGTSYSKEFADVLKRWCVEVNHWHLDMFFDQDKAAYDDDDAAFCSTIVSKFTMSVFNFAKRAYAAEENRYKGACTTPRLLRACNDISFSALLLESFFNDDARHLTHDRLSRNKKFMKEEERGHWTDMETYDHEPWPLQKFIEQHRKRKKQEAA